MPRWRLMEAEPHPCSYRPGQVAVTPLLLPLRPLTPSELDKALAEGRRRAGPLHYRTECPTCRACEPLRVPMDRFAPSRSQRRVLRRNEAEVDVSLRECRLEAPHAELYNRHKSLRGLDANSDGPLEAERLQGYFGNSGLPTGLVEYRVLGRLVAFSVVDIGATAISSVYHAFDPDESHRSLGTYSALAEMAFFGARGYRWYYLGLYVADCRSLAYKAQYLPHERLVQGHWLPFEADGER